MIPGTIHIGGLRFPVYALFAAAGIIAALALSRRTAKLTDLNPDKLWDAGVFSVVAAFLASRFLLVLFDLPSFVHYPLLVLALPSWTYGGMVLTALLVYLYLRRKHLPLLPVLDAWSPCACLLAAALSLGHFVEGTDSGMPTSLPWGTHTPGDSILGKVHPVQLYETALMLALTFALLRQLPRRTHPGATAATTLFAGGLIAFLLDMLRQPENTTGGSLDPGQIAAATLMLAAIALYLVAANPATLDLRK